MLVKCEAKSNRVKGLAFHPTMPWILSALHNGTIQLWDYQLGVLLDKFDEHEGPVRGMCFHANQPLFVSGGDDYKVKVWNYKLKRCLFTLLGHLDYIRTTTFHQEYPWILSASDDQTIRIWNWQSRQCIAVLTGHNHYVMCANFHPKDDLVISASLDQTIRVWDVSGLKEKTVSAHARPPTSTSGSADLFGVNDAVVKFVLEGHERGVNWAEFHPTQPMIASASDDRTVKLWRYNESKAWEVDTLRGHSNNVSAVSFHPRQDLIVSNGEDKTIRVWDATRRQLLHTFKRENDRFWVLACSKNSNSIAAGHDSGMVVFKLDRERPLCGAAVGSSGLVYVVKNRVLTAINPGDNSAIPIGNCRKQVSAMATGFKSLCVNPFNSTELNVLVTYDTEDAYDLFTGANQVVLKPSEVASVEAKKGSGCSVAFIARNRFAVLGKEGNVVNIYSTHNELSKKLDLPFNADAIFAGGVSNRLVLRVDDKVVLMDVGSREVIAELSLPGAARQVVWSASNMHVAFLLKHAVVIADGDFKFIQAINEPIRVKSGVWDDAVFVYSTSSHVKYALPFADEHGLIQAVGKPVYITKVSGGYMTIVDREFSVVRTKLFTHEYLFKQALLSGKSEEVLQHLKAGRLMGAVTIGYLKKKGFPEVALQFVADLDTRFNLSLEFGHVAEAFEAAKSIKKPEVWQRLYAAAIQLGNIEIAEKAAIANHDVEKLQFLYFLSGNDGKLAKLSHKVAKESDQLTSFNLALVRGDADERARILEDLHMDHLAAACRANAHKFTQKSHDQSAPSNWPVTVSMEAMFAAQWAGLEAAAKAAASAPPPKVADEDLFEDVVPVVPAATVDARAWADDDLDAELETIQLPVSIATGGEKAADVVAYGEPQERRWLSHRRLAVDLIAAGEFTEALALLQRRIALVNPEPLKPLFTDIVMGAHACVPGLPFTPSIPVPIQAVDGGPNVLFSAAFLRAKLNEAMHQVGLGNPSDALAFARYVIQALPLSLARSVEEEKELFELLAVAQRYASAMLVETTRRQLSEDPSQKIRELELAAYLCSAKLEPTHVLMVLNSAMTIAFKAKNFILASQLARRIITGAWGAGDEFVTAATTRARKVVTASEQNGTDAFKISFDPSWLTGDALRLCSGSLTPVHPNMHDKMISCPLCQSGFQPDWQGQTCTVCQLSAVGAAALGLQFIPL